MKCVACFRPLPVRPASLACVGSCEDESSARLNAEHGGVDVRRKPIFDAQLGACPRCHTPSYAEACPECRFIVPDGLRSPETDGVFCVGMAGARTTGKSLYLGVLVPQLQRLADLQQARLDALGDTRGHYQRQYGAQLIEQRNLLAPTAEATKDPGTLTPLVYSFTRGGRRTYLALRDAAGEDLEHLPERAPRLAFLPRADAVILMLDPLKIPELRSALQGVITVGELGGDDVDVLRNVVDLLRQGAGSPLTAARLAVVLAKADTLQHAAGVPGSPLHPVMVRTGSPLNRDPSSTDPGYLADDAALLDLEVRSLLAQLTGTRIQTLLDESRLRHQCFAVSALGAPPGETGVAAAGIAPFRVLDPVKWIMNV